MLKNRPNLLIKGNNLIALHTLKEYFRHAPQQDKVKLIYIDPPYNTGNDSFNYNDRFNHSTWLTFMKNRLEIARELLRDDGVIFVQCDDNEQAYLKVLMDEIFGRENFVACFAVQHNPRGRSLDKIMAKTHEYILCYVKKIENIKPFLIKKNDKSLAEYSKQDENGFYREMRLMNGNRFFTRETRPNLYYPIFVNPITNEVSLEKNDGWIEVLPINSLDSEQCWTWSKEKFNNEKHLIVARQVKGEGWRIYRKDYLNDDSSLTKTKSLLIEKEFNNENGTEELRALKLNFATPKPEALIKRIIEISTNENDLVLDFFAGSGTTLAVAHKMKRRYIGIEQMDYIESITKERLKKVIDGEQGGVSKAVSWSGGGNLIYCELANLNAKFIDMIENSSDENELNQIYEKLIKFAFIDYRVDIQNDLKDLEFAALEFIEKKRILKKCLDRNMDYIPYADMEDSDYKIDEKTKKLNDIFYKGSSDE